MSQYRRERRTRLATILAGGVVAGLPLLAAGPAVAAPPEVDFSGGGLGLLACDSKPSDGDVTVNAESTVVFANRLGQGATLRIDGKDASRVEKGGTSEVLFHRGTVRVEMVPDCMLNLNRTFDAVSVAVLPPNDPTDPASPPDSSGGSSSGGSSAGGSSGGQGSQGGTSDQANDGGTNGNKAPEGGASASPSSTASAPADGGVSPPDAGNVEGPGTTSGDEQGLAAEPISSVGTSGEGGPNGLLAIIAAVCVVGVMAGAIRAIVAQRATRTSVA